jgi:glycosyltransferase involved in cell wall biosynthesis
VKVALITEGTYPFVHGGVSVWCHHLIRMLPDVEFHVYGIAATAGRESAWAFPANVVGFDTIGLEPVPGAAFERLPRAYRRRFLDAFDRFVEATLHPPGDGETEFLSSLRELARLSWVVPPDIGSHSRPAFGLLHDRWRKRDVGDFLDRLGAPSLLDVLEVSSSLARFLRPLAVVPEGDIAHTTANGLSAVTALTGRWERQMPVVLTEHGVYLRERYLEAQKAPLAPRVAAYQLLFFRHLNDAVLQAADLVAPVSDFNRRWELETGAEPQRVVTIHNGVDPLTFPSVIGEPEIPTVSWVGRIDPLKDVETLLRAFAVARRQVPDARLRLFGPIPRGNEDYHLECVRLIEKLGLGSAVSFEGHTSRVSVAHESGHVVALSSISEGFPFTVLEAMMSGRATVSTDVGGVAEAVGDAGLLVPPRDPGALGEALIRVLTDRDLRRTLGRAARERALSLFTLGRMADRYRSVYESMSTGRPLVPELSLPIEPPVPISAAPSQSSFPRSALGGRS